MIQYTAQYSNVAVITLGLASQVAAWMSIKVLITARVCVCACACECVTAYKHYGASLQSKLHTPNWTSLGEWVPMPNAQHTHTNGIITLSYGICACAGAYVSVFVITLNYV